jgi:hypothetical protein
MTLVRFVPEADMQVLGPDSCSTLVSSIEIIREFQKAYGTTRLVRQSTQKDSREQKGPAELSAFSVKSGS